MRYRILAFLPLIVTLLLLLANYSGGATFPAAPVDSSAPQMAMTGDDAVDVPTSVAKTSPDPSQVSQATSPAKSKVNEQPMPSTTGVPGLFTVETGDVLPMGMITVSSYANKLSRAPGSVTVLSGGFNLGIGVAKKVTIFAQFEPYRHIHVGEPSQLSLNQPAGCPHDVYRAPVYCSLNPVPATPTPQGPAAGYLPEFPFIARDTTDYGPVALGLKINFYSETRGDPLSVALRGSVVIPTESAAAELARNGAQTGAFGYTVTLGLSKQFRNGIMLANNVTYVVVGNPKAYGETLLNPADQIIFGQGFMFPVRSKLQLLMEYTGVFFQEGHAFGIIGLDTPNTSFGPADPVDGVWGVRWYAISNTAFDIGYRHMLNLHQVQDRSGFIFKISSAFHWPGPK